ncbi:MAG: subfamily B ATP-binding cassette protein MsbA [Planctomycetota bacterium]|jgi:subfamily B ATP-binding cassette protein MsbA
MRPRLPRLFEFLLPFARPLAGMFVLVILLGGVSAILQKSVLLLLVPTWELLFPLEGRSQGLMDAAKLGGIGAWWDEFVLWILRGVGAESSDKERMDLLLYVAKIISVLALMAAIVQYAFVSLLRKAALLMVVGLRMSIARHLMGLSLRFHSQRKIGDLLSRVSSDVSTTLSVVNVSLKSLLQEPLAAITALAMAYVISPDATLVVVFGLPALAVPVMILMRGVRRGSTKSHTELGATLQILTQMFMGIRTVKAFRLEERELSRYQELNNRYIKATMKMVRAVALTRAWSILYSHVGLAVLLLMVGYLAIYRGGLASSAEMVTFFMLISGAYEAIKRTTRAATQVSAAAGCAERLQELFDARPDIVDAPDAVSVQSLGDGIHLEDVSFAYPDGDGNALENLTLDVRPGETLALVGPSGAGKSTLVDLLARFVEPTGGRIRIDSTDLRKIKSESWSEMYAMVMQEPFLFHASVEENIRYGKPDATEEELVSAARSAHAHEFISAMPQGYGTDVAASGDRLSGGQRQRITIARAILHGGPLLLLDEATSALDTESEAAVQAALDGLMSEHTVVVIAHRLSTIRNADRIAAMDNGRLVEIGTHDELLMRGGLYARLHAAQFEEAS